MNNQACKYFYAPQRKGSVSYARCSISCFLFVIGESVNAKVFVMLGEEELKELGVSFGGRMILRKLIEELK